MMTPLRWEPFLSITSVQSCGKPQRHGGTEELEQAAFAGC
jgi:hypothetical protein